MNEVSAFNYFCALVAALGLVTLATAVVYLIAHGLNDLLDAYEEWRYRKRCSEDTQV